MLDRLFSPEEVAATFPDGHRPSVRRLIRVARQVNCCCKLGRGIGFTADQVKQLQAYLSCSGSSVTRKDRLTGTSVAPLRGSTYLKVREQLNARKRKLTDINERLKSMPKPRLVESNPQLSRKRFKLISPTESQKGS